MGNCSSLDNGAILKVMPFLESVLSIQDLKWKIFRRSKKESQYFCTNVKPTRWNDSLFSRAWLFMVMWCTSLDFLGVSLQDCAFEAFNWTCFFAPQSKIDLKSTDDDMYASLCMSFNKAEESGLETGSCGEVCFYSNQYVWNCMLKKEDRWYREEKVSVRTQILVVHQYLLNKV